MRLGIWAKNGVRDSRSLGGPRTAPNGWLVSGSGERHLTNGRAVSGSPARDAPKNIRSNEGPRSGIRDGVAPRHRGKSVDYRNLAYYVS